MKVIVGLQNPEPAYAGTRHNVGSEVVQVLAGRHGGQMKRGPRRVRCRMVRVDLGTKPTLLAVPLLSMNVCGPAVEAALHYFKVPHQDLLVVHDDIDLPTGRLRLHEGRGHGGHNGVRSVISSLGTRGFWRLKIGLGRPPGRMDPADFVLGRFTRQERKEIDLLVEDAAEVVEAWMSDRDWATSLAAARRPPDR